MKTILVATDFSQAAINSIDYAVELAKYFNANLILVNAYPIPTGANENPTPLGKMATLRQGSKDGLVNTKKEILRTHENLLIDCYAEMGTPYDVIQNAAKEYKADLIVIGIVGGAGKIKEHFIGSTAVRMVQKSDVPVFIIPEKAIYKADLE